MLYGYARGLCALRTLAAYVPPATSYFCASSAFGARTAPGINPYRMRRFSRGPVPNAPTRQFGNANLGSPGPLTGKETQSSQSESCLGGWRCKGPSEELDRRHLGWTAPRNISRPSGQSRTKAKDGSGSELLSRMGLDDCCEERGHVAPGVERGEQALDNAWQRADLRQSNVRCQHEASECVQYLRVRFCFALPCCCCFHLFSPCLLYTVGESGMGPAPVYILFSFFASISRQLTPRDASHCVCLPHFFI